MSLSIVAEIPLKTLQAEVDTLVSLQQASLNDENLLAFLHGAIVAIAWLGGSPVSPSIKAQMLLSCPEVCQ